MSNLTKFGPFCVVIFVPFTFCQFKLVDLNSLYTFSRNCLQNSEKILLLFWNTIVLIVDYVCNFFYLLNNNLLILLINLSLRTCDFGLLFFILLYFYVLFLISYMLKCSHYFFLSLIPIGFCSICQSILVIFFLFIISWILCNSCYANRYYTEWFKIGFIPLRAEFIWAGRNEDHL